MYIYNVMCMVKRSLLTLYLFLFGHLNLNLCLHACAHYTVSSRPDPLWPVLTADCYIISKSQPGHDRVSLCSDQSQFCLSLSLSSRPTDGGVHWAWAAASVWFECIQLHFQVVTYLSCAVVREGSARLIWSAWPSVALIFSDRWDSLLLWQLCGNTR